METEFIYWRHITPDGIKVEEITGGEDKSGKVWRALAMQVWCENGRDGYRALDHLPSGAPVLEDAPVRVSITHTDHLWALASLPPTPEQDLTRFELRTALGIDAERPDREQVVKVRSKFLSEAELAMVPETDVQTNVVAWTAKEALYKAALAEGLDFTKDIRIETLPKVMDDALKVRADKSVPTNSPYGKGVVALTDPDGKKREVEFVLYTYPSDGYIVTLAYSPKCAKYKKTVK